MILNKKRNKCCMCGRKDSLIVYQKAAYCPECFERLKYCCICHEKPVEVTWKDKGYCRECYYADINKGFHRYAVILTVIFAFLGVYQSLHDNTSFPALANISLATVSGIAAGIFAKIVLKKWG